jgi:predicted amidophosphoribosyltransferase
MECPNCERVLVKRDKFCPDCGNANPGYVKPEKKSEDPDRLTPLEKRLMALEEKFENATKSKDTVL